VVVTFRAAIPDHELRVTNSNTYGALTRPMAEARVTPFGIGPTSIVLAGVQNPSDGAGPPREFHRRSGVTHVGAQSEQVTPTIRRYSKLSGLAVE
jgi:hypothetical protein